MALRLKALAAKEPGFAGGERVLDSGALTIGRGPENDWTLQDDDRQVSKSHCRIESRNGRSELIDLSSNGVFFEGDDAPLGLGIRRDLKAGDVFLIGDYRFMVTQDSPAAPVAAPTSMDGPVTISDILGGSSEAGAETRASHAVSGEAPLWLEDLPKGAANGIIQAPFGWSEPPAAGSPALPVDAAMDFASSFSDASEHIPASGGTIRLPGVQTVLPDDWYSGQSAAPASPASSAPPAPGVAAAPPQHLLLLDAAGLTRAQLRDKLPDAVLGHAGALLGSLVDGLRQVTAALDNIEHDLALRDGPATAETYLGSVADLLDPDGGGDTEVSRAVIALVARVRCLGEAIRSGANDVGNHLRPDGIERRARAGMAFPAWPIYRQVCWKQYVDDFQALGRGGDPADVVLGPVRAAFARTTEGGPDTQR